MDKMTHHLRHTAGRKLGVALDVKRQGEPAVPSTATLGVMQSPDGGGATVLSFRGTAVIRSPHFPRLGRVRPGQLNS